jgi:hypothetical protein
MATPMSRPTTANLRNKVMVAPFTRSPHRLKHRDSDRPRQLTLLVIVEICVIIDRHGKAA